MKPQVALAVVACAIAFMSNSAASQIFNATNTTYDELDIVFQTFSEARLPRYLAALAQVVGVPVGRIVPLRLENRLALEFGMEYLFPVKISAPSNLGSDTRLAVDVARDLESRLSSITKETHPVLYKATVTSARRVKAEFRERVESTQGVNYVWVAFLIIGLIMLVSSAGVLLRPRGTDADIEEQDEYADEKEIPDDRDTFENAKKLQVALLEAQREQETKDREWRLRRLLDAKKSLNMLDVTLEYDRNFALPGEHKREMTTLARNGSMASNPMLRSPTNKRESSTDSDDGL